MLRCLDAEDLALFEEEDMLDPWGPERGDLQAGIVAAELFGIRRRCPPPPADTFRLTFVDEAQAEQEHKSAVRGELNAAIAGWRGVKKNNPQIPNP